MKTKLVLWGNDANDDKILIAMQLRPDNNAVDIWTFPEKVATEAFAKSMMDDWRNDVEVTFPEDHKHVERELTVSDSLLPDDIKTERTDLIQRAQTEWHFIVLSSKLNEVYQAELKELKEKVENLTSFDSQVWDDLKNFWNKVLVQVRDRNLFREHVNSLRETTNKLFDRLKQHRSALDDEFKTLSKTHHDKFFSALEDIEQRVKGGVSLTGAFDELKEMQRRFRNTKMTKEHKAKIWEKLDKAFKDIKEKKFGPLANRDSTPVDRLNRRYDGLLIAIDKMRRSIARDEDDLVFENKKIASTDGQLEAQIRQAKIKMIEERIRSKEEKLGEMNNTKVDLENRLVSLKDKEAKRAERDKLEQAKVAAKAKIKDEMKKREEAMQKQNLDIEKAALAISSSTEAPAVETPPTPVAETTPVTEAAPAETPAVAEISVKTAPPAQEESMVEAITTTIGESLEDVVDTVKAVAEVVGGKIGSKIAEMSAPITAEATKVADVTESVAEEAKETVMEDAAAVEEVVEEVIEESATEKKEDTTEEE